MRLKVEQFEDKEEKAQKKYERDVLDLNNRLKGIERRYKAYCRFSNCKGKSREKIGEGRGGSETLKSCTG